MTDADFVLAQLERGPRDAMQIISASLREREVGLTVHSRVADLRAQGYKITCQIEGKTRKGRERYVYRLQTPGVWSPGRRAVARGAEIPAALLDVNPDQLMLVHDRIAWRMSGSPTLRRYPVAQHRVSTTEWSGWHARNSPRPGMASA